jgi:hypothetical protein
MSSETLIKIVLLAGHFVILNTIARGEVSDRLSKMRIQTPRFGKLRRLYLFGLIFLQIFSSIIQPIFFKSWQFLPLMLISVYCALGMMYSWYLFWTGYWQDLSRTKNYATEE